MEILTLLKANIRHKKGAFFSIMILMMMIAMSLTTILSIIDNSLKSIEQAHEVANTGDVQVLIRDSGYTKEREDALLSHPMVERVDDFPAVFTEGGSIGGKETSSSWNLLKLHDNVKLFNEDFSGYEESTPSLNPGEIYVSEGLLSMVGGEVGDTLKAQTIGGNYEFTVKGIVLEPYTGSAVIGMKQLYISDEDFEKIYREAKAQETEENSCNVHILVIHKTDECNLENSEFCRELNKDTGILDYAIMSLTKDESIYYTNLMPEIIVSALVVFLILLVVIVLIVIVHNISTSIEMEYLNLGILKSQGFGKERIRMVFFLQYFLAQLTGIVLGMVVAVPVIQALGNLFFPITGVISNHSISFGKIFAIMFGIMLLSGCFIYLATAKIGRISPIRAISGGREEIYFDSRVNVPIYKKGLSASLALRQFTSCKRRYAATIAVVSILVFFMMTINILGNLLTSKSTLEAMGMFYTELDVEFYDKMEKEQALVVEQTIEEITSIEKKYYTANRYFTFEGDKMAGMVLGNPEVLIVFKGRAPLYDNEIVITEILAEEYQLKIGDEVTIGYHDEKSEYIIAGIFQTTNDTGKCFSISSEGAMKIGMDEMYYAGYSLKEPEKRDEVATALNDEFGEILVAKAYNGSNMDDSFQMIIDAMKVLIYSISIVFALVVVLMVCSKAFIQERTDIGIYKAIGFTSNRLRLQFAIRFFIVSMLGSGIGAVLSLLFSGKLLGGLLRSLGLTNFVAKYTPSTLIYPVALIGICFFVFAFLVSGKTKKVEVRELVTE
ncbi:MAG: ABC transporter permease [Lachnospiraceae bacterium]|nr:ABC transporter permease [Lachnospiraceae bacterium]